MQRIFSQTGAAVRLMAFAGFASLLVAGFFFTPVGCGPTTNPTPYSSPKPFAGKSLKIAVADPLLGAEIRGRAKAWANRHNATVTIVFDKPPHEIAEADIAVVPQEGIFGPASRGELAPVPETLTGNGKPFRWDTLFVPYQTALVQWGSKVVAVPIAGDGLVCVYRADRFREPLAAKAFRDKFQKDLVAPRTWEDVAEIGAVFQQPGRPSLAPLPADRTAALAQFNQIAACYDRLPLGTGKKEAGDAARALSFYVDVETLEPRLNAPAFAHTFGWFHATAAYRPNQAGDPLLAITTGTAVVALLTLREVAQLPRDPKTGAISDAYGIAPVPGTRSYFNAEGQLQEAGGGRTSIPYFGWAGAYAVVFQKSANADAAWDFLADLAGPEGSAGTLSESTLGVGPTRETHLSTEVGGAVWQRYGFDKARTDELGLAMQSYVSSNVTNPALPLRTPDAPEVNTILETQLRRAAAGQATGPEAAKAAIQAWAAHDSKQNPQQLKEWRRKSVGIE